VTAANRRPPALPSSRNTMRLTLPNGIALLLRENPASPAVVVSGYLEVGRQDEPAHLRGLSNYVADAVERGSQHRPFDVLYEQIEEIAATFAVRSGAHITSFGGRCLADALPIILEILGEVLRQPAFEPDQVEKCRTEILTSLQEREHSTTRLAGLIFNNLTYPESHPYHWSGLGYRETVERISREDVIDFHTRHYGPNGMTVAIVGGIQIQDTIHAVESVFADWRAERVPRAPVPNVPPLPERREKRVLVEDKTQANLVLGWPGPERRHADFMSAFVTNTLLGVYGLHGRLGKRLREQSGLAYYAYSQIDGGMGPGPWRILSGVASNAIERAVDLIRDELRLLRDVPVDPDELSDVQSFLTGSLPMHLETNEGVARALINMERYGLGLDYLEEYSSLVNSVTIGDVQTIANRWLDPDCFALAVAQPTANPKAGQLSC